MWAFQNRQSCRVVTNHLQKSPPLKSVSFPQLSLHRAIISRWLAGMRIQHPRLLTELRTHPLIRIGQEERLGRVKCVAAELGFGFGWWVCVAKVGCEPDSLQKDGFLLESAKFLGCFMRFGGVFGGWFFLVWQILKGYYVVFGFLEDGGA